jgi:hypothetical protein
LPNQTVACTTVLLTENTANNGGPDGTARVTLWESRTSPDFFYKKGRFHERPFFIFSVNNFDCYFRK